MKSKVMKLWESLILRKQFIITIVFDQLKDISQIEPSWHRRCISFIINLLGVYRVFISTKETEH
nr:transposase [Candidatus Enterovibrio escacola]